MESKSNNRFFKFCLFIWRLFNRRFHVCSSGETVSPAVYIVHHQNLKGPIISMGWFNKAMHLWILSVFCDRKTCFHQFYDYTFTKRFGWPKFLAAIVAYPLSVFISGLMRSMETIPVFRGSKSIVNTFRLSTEALIKGNNLLISPDIAYTDTSSNIGRMYDGFLDLEKYYIKKSGKHLPFIPLRIDQHKYCIVEGNAIYFNTTDDFKQEKSKASDRLKQEFSRLEGL